MNFAKLSHRTSQFCFGLVFSLAVLLSGCGGGGGGSSTASLSSITILPSSTSVAPIYVATGQTVRLSATAKYSDGTTADISTQVTWTSVSPSVASVVSPGVVTGVAVNGSTTITAKLNGVTSIIPANITVTGIVIPTLGLATPRWDHTANLLPVSGVAAEMVLVAGGYTGGSPFAAIDSSELYDPSTDRWTVTGRLNIARGDHASTRLQNGQILVTGGADGTVDITSCELYDPNTGLWTVTGNLLESHSYHTATLLTDGTVLVVGGGMNLNSTELYDPGLRTWTYSTPLAVGRYSHSATLLPNGKVLVMGGFNPAGIGASLTRSELFTPGSPGTWSQAVISLNQGRFSHTATLLPNGKVLVIGGAGSNGIAINSVELCDLTLPLPATCTPTTPLNTARLIHTATLLPNGKVLVMGGDDINNNELSSAELYDPTVTPTTSTQMVGVPGTPLGPLTTPRDNFTATLLSNGSVLAAGGFDGTNSLSSSELH